MNLEERLAELRYDIHQKAKYLSAACVRYYGAVPTLTAEIVEYTGFILKFNPDQPRVPAGNPDGGQWTSGGGGVGSDSAEGFARNDAVAHLNDSAHATSQGRCAQYVRQAIQAGGVTVDPPSPPVGMTAPPARIYGPALEDAGFTPVTQSDQPATYPPSGYTPQAGDVAIIQPTSQNPDGHMAMYNGGTWVSDFTQRSFWPGSTYRTEKPSFVIYRHAD